MIPYKPRTATIMPETLEKQLEVTAALRTLAARDHEQLQQRRPEIAALRRELDLMAQSLHAICRELALSVRSQLCKYDPDQPRVPAGSADGGQWTSEDASATPEIYTTNRRIALSIEEKCEAQFEKDLIECRLAASAACYAQAMLRYSNCLRGLPIPPLNY